MQDIELAQCYICQDSLHGKKLWAPLTCGHVYCEDCAFQQFTSTNDSTKRCAVCRKKSRRDDLVQIYIDYGHYSVQSILGDDSNGQEDIVSYPGRTISLIRQDAFLRDGSAACDAIRKLADVAPLEWKNLDCDVSQPFVAAGRFLETVGQKMEDEDLKPIIVNLGQAVSSFQKCITSILTLSQTLTDLQAQNTRLQNTISEKESMHKEELREREEFTHEIRAAFELSESEILQKLHQTRESLSIEKENRKSVEERLGEVGEERERWRRSAVGYKKKYFSAKQKLDAQRVDGNGNTRSKASRREETLKDPAELLSDDSLEIEIEDADIDDAIVPSSSFQRTESGSSLPSISTDPDPDPDVDADSDTGGVLEPRNENELKPRNENEIETETENTPQPQPPSSSTNRALKSSSSSINTNPSQSSSTSILASRNSCSNPGSSSIHVLRNPYANAYDILNNAKKAAAPAAVPRIDTNDLISTAKTVTGKSTRSVSLSKTTSTSAVGVRIPTMPVPQKLKETDRDRERARTRKKARLERLEGLGGDENFG